MLEYNPTEKDVIEALEEVGISLEARQETDPEPEPCPLCGKKDFVGVFVHHIEEKKDGLSYSAHVECLRCFLRIGHPVFFKDEATAKREAIENWNRKVWRLQ